MPDLELKEMEELAGLGTQYFLTTPIFDLDSFNQFMNKVGPIHIPVIAEIILVRSAEMGLFLNKHVKAGLVPNHIIEKRVESQVPVFQRGLFCFFTSHRVDLQPPLLHGNEDSPRHFHHVLESFELSRRVELDSLLL